MDFERVLKNLLQGFDQRRIRYALMGGFALGALGAPRATMDLDFLVHRDDLESLHALMVSLGYARRYHTENVSQYASQDAAWGGVDVVHAFRTVSLAMLDRATEKPILGRSRLVRLLQPEDLIGLKVQALANDPTRRMKEMADIEALMQVYHTALDWTRLAEFFELFGLSDELRALRGRFDRVD
jgi:hypothetical protein